MSLEAQLHTALYPLAAGGASPDIPPSNPTWPLIVYQQVGGQAFDFMEGKVPDKDNARVQVWVWADTRVECSQIMRDVRLALVEGPLGAGTLGAPVSEYHETLGKYGARQDFSVWYVP